MRFHGNYCGPNWSAGKVQNSVVSDLPGIDEFDESCRLHDAHYALGDDLLDADIEFVSRNIGQGFKQTVAATAVAVQAAFRVLDKSFPKIYQNKEMSLRGKSKSLVASNKNANANNARVGSHLSTVPAAYGYGIKKVPTSVTRSGNKAIVRGSDFACLVTSSNTSRYEPAASVMLSPAYFNNAALGQLTRIYEKYRFRRAVVQYIPSVPTSTQGQVVMCKTSTVKEPFISGDSGAFLGRALSQSEALATPIWKEDFLDVNLDDSLYIVDPLIDSDLDDAIQAEIQVYATSDSATTCGIIMVHYEIEFCDPLFVYHPTVLPITTAGVVVVLNDNSAVNATTDAIVMTAATPLTSQVNGSIFRLIFQQTRSVLPTGPANWGVVARAEQLSAATSTTNTITFTNVAMQTGTTLYGVLNGTDLALYASYDGANASSLSEVLCYQTATTAVGAWSFIVTQVKVGASIRLTTQ